MLLLLLSFSVSSAGCHVFLPGGAELLFPPGCLAKATRLEWVEKRPERKWVRLEEHDILLSRPLELRPHGVTFLKVIIKRFIELKYYRDTDSVCCISSYICVV